MQLNYSFMGLILGTTPTLLKNSTKGGRCFKLHYLLYTIITFIISIILINYQNTASYSCSDINFSSLYYTICGLFMSIGIIVPTPQDTAKKIVSHSSLLSAIIPILQSFSSRLISDVPKELTFWSNLS